jgi:hypothetical protein
MKNTNSKTAKIFAEILVLGSLLMGVTNVAFATTAAVTATVKLQNIQVTVSDGSVNYGVLALSTTVDTVATSGTSHLSDPQIANNTGNIAEDLTIKGKDATTASSTCTLGGSPSLWYLSSTSTSADHYTHKFSTSTTGVNFNFLSTSYTTLKSNLSASTTQSFDLQLTTPTASSCYDPQSVDITVSAACAAGVSC